MTTLGAPTVEATYELDNYILDFIAIEHFKAYYYSNLNLFTSNALNSYLKALDVPPKFFKEQPAETQDELLNNREVFVREHKKYIDKVIVVAKSKLDGQILNACRMSRKDAEESYNNVKNIVDIPNRFEHRSFTKDNYITYVISDKLENSKDNRVLVVDFPITLNKPVIIHKATYTLPDDTFIAPVEHIHYLSSDTVSFSEYSTIKDAIEDALPFLSEETSEGEVKPILRESGVVSLALSHIGVLPASYVGKFATYLNNNIKSGLDTAKLESAVLDFDETFRGYKQVTALRSVNGGALMEVLESSTFAEFLDEMEETLDEINSSLKETVDF